MSPTPADESGLTIYVGVPYCNSKCHFCRYVADIETSALVGRQSRYADYVQAVVRQVDHFLPELLDSGRPVRSVYFGGGTPTVLETVQLAEILAAIERCAGGRPGCTVTLETTPENVPGHDFRALRAAGFNRISMGVQSMQDAVLAAIGRSHRAHEVPEAVQAFQAAGFTNVNVDMLFGLPNESFADVAYNLEKFLELGVNHYSIYLYEPDPRTVTARLCTAGYDADELVERFELVRAVMEGAGYRAYNCFYYTRDGQRCEVDEAYYTLKNEWIGFGAAAHSLLDRRMYRASTDSNAFIGDPLTLGPSVEARSNATYLYMLSTYMLYSDEGVRFDRFQRSIGIGFDEALDVSPELRSWYERAFATGHLERTAERVRFTDWREQARFVAEHTARRFGRDILKSRKFAQPFGTEALS